MNIGIKTIFMISWSMDFVCDPLFNGARLRFLTVEHQIALAFYRPGKPTDNAFTESFNGSFRDKCLNVHWFLSLDDTQIKAENWRQDYNLFRRNSLLDNFIPNEFVLKFNSGNTSNFTLFP